MISRIGECAAYAYEDAARRRVAQDPSRLAVAYYLWDIRMPRGHNRHAGGARLDETDRRAALGVAVCSRDAGRQEQIAAQRLLKECRVGLGPQQPDRIADPQIPIKKYIGTRTISQNTKNRIRSNAMNVPAMPVSKSSINARNALVRPGSGT